MENNQKISFDDAIIEIEAGKMDKLWAGIVSKIDNKKEAVIEMIVNTFLIGISIVFSIIMCVLFYMLEAEIEKLGDLVGI